MPSSDLSHWLLLAQRLFHNLVALLCVPSTRFGHLFPPAGSPAFLWPSYSHLSRLPNLMIRATAHDSLISRYPGSNAKERLLPFFCTPITTSNAASSLPTPALTSLPSVHR